jgi:hypothetical protein
MTRSLILSVTLPLAFTAALGSAPGQAQMGHPGQDCAGEARFASRPLGDGRYLYQFTMANPSRNTGLRYNYSFTLPGGAGHAEALNGYLPPGGSTEHTLGSGGRDLGAEALRAATTLRCFPL